MSSVEKATLKLRKFYQDRKRLPSYREMMELFDYRSVNSAWKLTEKLISKNIIEKDDKGKLLPKNLNHQLKVLGTVEAGFPTLAEQEVMDTISLDQYLLTRPEQNYMLKVTGLSMIEAGISPDDLVIVEKDKEPKNGDIVVAEVDGNWTMKYFQKKDGEVILLPANKDYPPIRPQSDLRVGGVVTSVIKKFY